MRKNNLDQMATDSELARAFGGEAAEPRGFSGAESARRRKTSVQEDGEKHAPILGIVALVVGLIVLAIGVVMLVLKLSQMNQLQDGEYLTSVKEWVLEDGTNCGEVTEPTNCANGGKVIWKFTEIGKGTLTTNGHVNDYNFIWAIKNGELQIETDWLYQLENNYTYKLDQSAGTLTLTTDNDSFVFHAIIEP